MKTKKMMCIGLIIAALFSLTACNGQKEKFKFNDKVYIEERDDGWFYVSNISTGKDSEEDYYYYEYDAYNLKHKKLENYYIGVYDSQTGEKIDYATPVLPYLSLLPDTQADIKNIMDLFAEKKFVNKISETDLKELNLSYIQKSDLINMYNKTVSQEYLKEGLYPDIPAFNMKQSLLLGGYKWQAAYICYHGTICAFNIELIYCEANAEIYLSDLVQQNTATQEQAEIFTTIQEIENAILSKSDFSAANISNINIKHDIDFNILDTTIQAFLSEE